MKPLHPVLLVPLIACSLVSGAEVRHSYRFQFGGTAASGVTLVLPSTTYSAERGFGFESNSNLTVTPPPRNHTSAEHSAITSAEPFFFSVRLPEGDYLVSVTLGDPDAAAVTTVKTETRQLVLERIRTGKGEFVQRSFAVNVRGPELRDGSLVNLDSREMDLTKHRPTARHWDDKLTLEFSDEHPAVAEVDIAPADQAITLFITGDSTVTDQPNWPSSSWGQMSPRWFKPQVAVANHAESGETLKGFLKERRWDKVLESIKPGDYVIIEFGTNDSKSRGPQNIYPGQDFSETYASADTTYKELLRRFVADARKRGASPIIVSPSARRGEVAHPTSLQPWADAAMEVAKELGVPGIDLNSMGVEINRALGPEGARQFADRTHHVEYGSYLQAKCIALGIQRSGIPLAKYITVDFRFDPQHPEPLPSQFDLPPDPHPVQRGSAR